MSSLWTWPRILKRICWRNAPTWIYTLAYYFTKPTHIKQIYTHFHFNCNCYAIHTCICNGIHCICTNTQKQTHTHTCIERYTHIYTNTHKQSYTNIDTHIPGDGIGMSTRVGMIAFPGRGSKIGTRAFDWCLSTTLSNHARRLWDSSTPPYTTTI